MKSLRLHVEKLIQYVCVKMEKYLDGAQVCMDN